MALEDLSTFTTPTGAVTSVSVATNVDHLTYLQLLDILEDMLSHTHQFDDN